MAGQVQSMLLKLRSSALVLSLSALALAACASSEEADFGTSIVEEDGGKTDANKPDAKTDADTGDAGDADLPDDGGTDGGAGGSGGGPTEPDSCGGQPMTSCPEPQYADFQKCCTSGAKCGFKNGPSGFCYDAEEEDPTGGAGGGP